MHDLLFERLAFSCFESKIHNFMEVKRVLSTLHVDSVDVCVSGLVADCDATRVCFTRTVLQHWSEFRASDQTDSKH